MRTDHADKRETGVDADPRVQEIDPLRALLLAEALRKAVDVESRCDRPIGMIGLWLRGAEKRQHAIAEKRIHQAAIGKDRGADAFEILVENARETFRVDPFGEGRETGDISKDDR